MHDNVPPDPFAGDPDDPAATFGDARAPESLNRSERDGALADLADLEVYRSLLEPAGIKGLTIACDECDDTHYISWDLLVGGLAELVDNGTPQLHEPAFDPDPNDYVSWDYARGYVDGVIDSEENHGP